ncbi:MAG: reverse transcriptase family protein, partial [Fusobacteriaceae bacterium]
MIEIKGNKYYAVFDTGAAVSVITSCCVKNKNLGLIKEISENVVTVSGERIEMRKSVDIEFKYNGKSYKETFNIINNVRKQMIYLGNRMVKEIEGTKKEFPVRCVIDTRNASPISSTRPIRSLQDKKDFQVLVADLENRGVIEESNSLWLNPVVLVRKKTGDLRFCVDLRKLNSLVELDRFEIPRINEIIAQLRNAKYFTLIDLKDAYFHVEINEDDRKKTAFYSGKRLMKFRKMPQGFKNAPAIFQRAMNIIFKDKLNDGVLVYIDDLLVYGKTEEEHNDNLRYVLKLIQDYKLEENKLKRIEKAEQVNFLGYRISYNNIKPLESRCQGIIDFREPRNKKDLQRFIGLLNYDR